MSESSTSKVQDMRFPLADLNPFSDLVMPACKSCKAKVAEADCAVQDRFFFHPSRLDNQRGFPKPLTQRGRAEGLRTLASPFSPEWPGPSMH